MLVNSEQEQFGPELVNTGLVDINAKESEHFLTTKAETWGKLGGTS